MSIRVEDEPHALLELLWVRDVHGLRPPGDVPPPLTDPPTARRSPADTTALSNAWSELWHDAVAHLAELDRSDPERYAEALTVFAAHRRGRS